MSKILKVALASAMLIAGSSMAFAADNGGRDAGRGPGNSPFGGDKGPSIDEKQDIDGMSTGSISNCDSQMFDQKGKCVVDPGYQNAR